MKVALLVLASLAAAVCAEEYGGYRGHYYPGFEHVHNGIASAYRNDVRQEAVNSVAEHYGSGTGTARFVGVPGTNGYFGYRHHGHGAGYGGYGGGYGAGYGAGYGGGYGY